MFYCCRLSKTADRLYTEALSNEDSNDEERAYVFYLRYISVITIIRKTNQYKKDKVREKKNKINFEKPVPIFNSLVQVHPTSHTMKLFAGSCCKKEKSSPQY